MAKFEAPGIKSKFIRPFVFSENLEDLCGERGLTLQQLFPYKSYSFKNSDCHEILFFNDGGLKRGHFNIFDAPFPFLAFVRFI